MIRLFVGLSVSEGIRNRLAALSGGIPGARWIAPKNMHITLKFIGDIENGLADDIDIALQAVRANPMELNLNGVGVFGKKHGGRLIWVGVQSNDALLRLYGKVEVALNNIGIARETRKFLPHVTIARLRNASVARVEAFVAEHAAFTAGPFGVSEITLFSSYLATSGAVYRAEAKYSLQRNI